eukprot:TRINITY_DN7342_c0_g1_i1.p1 TRINITY_DN7342_c0_g1~~TRINITY_DN7342_c0_g1_i1.p1  ORF type:complete len:103 (+),score=1.71 TRINITY_DN7342_c0_g1_i1:405-713(+)
MMFEAVEYLTCVAEKCRFSSVCLAFVDGCILSPFSMGSRRAATHLFTQGPYAFLVISFHSIHMHRLRSRMSCSLRGCLSKNGLARTCCSVFTYQCKLATLGE